MTRMMHVGLVGTQSFYEIYKNALKQRDVLPPKACSLEEALNNSAHFENLTLQCQAIFFEEIQSSTYNLITAALKNGKNVIIDKCQLSIAELNEMYHIAVEGNLNCTLLNSSLYYQFFEPLQNDIKNPFYIEMLLEYPSDRNSYLSENIENTMFECMLTMQYIQRSEIKQINVKAAKLFSEQTDFISIQLDFSDGCSASIKMLEKPSGLSNTIQIYQNGQIISMDLTKKSISKTECKTGNLAVSLTNVEDIDITDKKIEHFLNIENSTQKQANSILDQFLAREQSDKILKKINSLNE